MVNALAFVPVDHVFEAFEEFVDWKDNILPSEVELYQSKDAAIEIWPRVLRKYVRSMILPTN